MKINAVTYNYLTREDILLYWCESWSVGVVWNGLGTYRVFQQSVDGEVKLVDRFTDYAADTFEEALCIAESVLSDDDEESWVPELVSV